MTMWNSYDKAYAQRLVASYIEEIEDLKKDIIKNRGDMDLHNADIENEFDDIINDILTKYTNLINEIEQHSNFS